MSNKNHTDITIVLDRSGSMSSVAADTIGGFNRFLADQKKAAGTATITLNQFDDQHERVLDAVDIQKAQDLTHQSFVPRGSTALLDAMGRAITDTGKRLDALPEKDRPEKVVFVTITDGQENASSEFSRAKIFQMVKHQREKYAWEFVFLGANQDAIAVGASIGVSVANTMTYASNSAGVASAYTAMASNLTSFRSGSKKAMDFEDLQKKAQADAGAKQK